MGLVVTEEMVVHVNRICRYLALDDFQHRAPEAGTIQARTGTRGVDVAVVFGSAVLATVEEACRLLNQGLAARLLFSGGVGHSTALLFENIRNSARLAPLVSSGAIHADMKEADMMAVIARTVFSVRTAAILVENRSTNTGENARFSWDLLRARMPGVLSLLILQDPLLQRRAVLTLQQALSLVPVRPVVLSAAAFVPEIGTQGFVNPPPSQQPAPWSLERCLALALGEVERLRNDERGYGPNGRGYIPAEDVPAEVLASYHALTTAQQAT